MSSSERHDKLKSLDHQIQMTQSMLRAIEHHRSRFRDGDLRGSLNGRVHRLKRSLTELEKKRAKLAGW